MFGRHVTLLLVFALTTVSASGLIAFDGHRVGKTCELGIGIGVTRLPPHTHTGFQFDFRLGWYSIHWYPAPEMRQILSLSCATTSPRSLAKASG
jgi:hypothetical protein